MFVTGTFDHWSKSVQLDKKGDSFEKEVELPIGEDKILYKVMFHALISSQTSFAVKAKGFSILCL